jgi:hypothetical protein
LAIVGSGALPVLAEPDDPVAHVRKVETRGSPGAYLFLVSVESPDSGCDRYADWWEVVSPEGKLLYRRILRHSHVGEQPFSRSGGPVPVGEHETVVVRAHMRPGGYGGSALEGSVGAGFTVKKLGPDFAPELEKQPPQPEACLH